MPNKITSYQTAENGKFVEITGNTQYPAISVVRLSYPDTSNAFPENSGLTPVSSVDVYSKYAVLTKLINPEDIKISLSAENINVNLDEIELNTDELEGLTENSNTLLNELTSSNVRIAGFSIPPYDEIDLEYEGATEYIRKVSYLENTTEVLSLSFVYVTEPPTSSDNRILKVKKL